VAPGYKAVSPQWSLSGVFTRHLRFKSGGIKQLINGLELVLANSRFTRKGPKRKFSEFLIPDNRKTAGPGKSMFLSWKEMMYLAGEFVGETEIELRRSYQNWNNWMRCLQRNGYYCKDGREAEAYDTIKIVSRTSGNRHHLAGAWIRASSRFTEAVRLQQSDQMETMSTTDFLSATLRP